MWKLQVLMVYQNRVIMIDVRRLLSKTNKVSSCRLRKLSPEEKQAILEAAGVGSLTEAVYLLHHSATPGACEACGARTAFKSFTAGYRRFCSSKCSANSDSTAKARADTCQRLYGAQHAQQSAPVQEKIKQSNLARHGVEYPMQSASILEKRATTNIARYGGRSPRASDAIRKKTAITNIARYGGAAPQSSQAVRQKIRATQKSRWLPEKLKRLSDIVHPLFESEEYDGIENSMSWQCSACAHEFSAHLKYGKIPRCPKCYPVHISKGEQEVADFVSSLGFDIEQQNKTLLSPLHVDIVVQSKRLGIEFNGLYYHHAGYRDQSYHRQKTEGAEAAGYQLLHIFDDEWREQRDCVENLIRSKLGVLPKVYARKCQVISVASAHEREFLDAHHMQGFVRSKVSLGLVHEGKLVAVMSFGKPRFNKTAEWELLRYASSATIVGGASKLLSHFERGNNPTTILSYADRRWSTGNLYRTLGFEERVATGPGFYYTDCWERFNRMQFQKHKLAGKLSTFDPRLTEEENMRTNKLYRVYDSGHRVFFKSCQ
jgi:very-short-patch-repair endonuclease